MIGPSTAGHLCAARSVIPSRRLASATVTKTPPKDASRSDGHEGQLARPRRGSASPCSSQRSGLLALTVWLPSPTAWSRVSGAKRLITPTAPVKTAPKTVITSAEPPSFATARGPCKLCRWIASQPHFPGTGSRLLESPMEALRIDESHWLLWRLTRRLGSTRPPRPFVGSRCLIRRSACDYHKSPQSGTYVPPARSRLRL
jgi:hypothetical protein